MKFYSFYDSPYIKERRAAIHSEKTPFLFPVNQSVYENSKQNYHPETITPTPKMVDFAVYKKDGAS